MNARPDTIITMRPLYIERAQIPAVTTLSESTWDTLVAKGEAPQPRKISANRSAWLFDDIEVWAHTRPVSDLLPPRNSGKGRSKNPQTA